MIVAFELCGFIAVLCALALAVRKAAAIPEAARLPLWILLGLLALGHVANLIEQFGGAWADAIADDSALFVPLVWVLFLVEMGRNYLRNQVRVQSEQLSFLVQRVPASVAWLDAEGRIGAASRVWESALPGSVGRRLLEALPVPLEGFARALDDLSETAAERQGEDQARDSSGRARYFRWSLRRVADPDGARPGALVILEEVTEAVESEAARTAAVEDLARAQRAADLGQLAAGAAHDLNNMLHVIRCAAEELAGAGGRHPALDDIRQAVDSASTLTRTLLRLGAGRDQGLTRLDLCALVTQVETLLKVALGRRHTLLLSRPDSPIFITGDAARLEQAILNLVVNARDASPSGAPIEVTLERDEAVVRLRVRDYGVGIPDSIRAQLFRPFFTTKGARGTGLGLVTVQSTAHRHGGTVSVESQPGTGTTFELRIPLASDDEVVNGSPRGAGATSRPSRA